MTLNIALNTIIIIMVFLFPGIIVRKSFFTNTFKNRYESGNVLDKIVWNILVSIISLVIFSLFYNVISFFLSFVEDEFNIFHDIKANIKIEYKDIYCIFDALSKSNLPSEFENYDNFIKYIIYILLVYLFSFFIGKVFYKLIKKSKIEKGFSFLQFSNDWEYLISPNHSNFSDLKDKKGYTTWIDVLIGEKDKKDLYRGIVERIIYDKENRIENIILKKTILFIQIDIEDEDISEITEDIILDDIQVKKEYIIVNGKKIDKDSIHTNSNNRIVYKKIIAGDFFVIPNKEIKNINFSYQPPLPIKELKSDLTQLTTTYKENRQTNYTSWIFLISSMLISIFWYNFEVSKILNQYIFIEVLIQLLKGAFLILYVLFFSFTIYSFFKNKNNINENLNRIYPIIVFTFFLFGIFYNIPIVYTITVFISSVILTNNVNILFSKKSKTKNNTFLNAIIISTIYLSLILYFVLLNINQ